MRSSIRVLVDSLRARYVRARRWYQRVRRWRRRDEEEVSLRYRAYRVLRRSLQKEIKIAKDRAWSELVEAVESDSWGRLYRIVTRKLLAKGALATTKMAPALLLQIIEMLFPFARGHCGRTIAGNNLDGGVDGRLGSHGGRVMGGDQDDFAVGVPADMRAGRGRQAPQEGSCCPSEATHIGMATGLARKPVRLPEGTLDD